MPPKCIILCGGQAARWQKYCGVEHKHLVVVEGEVLLERTLRQVKKFVPGSDITVVVRESAFDAFAPYCKKAGVTLHTLKTLPNDTTEVVKYLDSQPLWNDNGRTVCLLGDVWFSDAAIRRILAWPSREWRIYGRLRNSRFTGCPWGEIFGISFYSYDKHLAKLCELDDLYRAGEFANLSSGWALYYLMTGLRQENPHECFIEINDYTDDFDFPHDYDRWIEHRANKELRRDAVKEARALFVRPYFEFLKRLYDACFRYRLRSRVALIIEHTIGSSVLLV